MGVRCKQVIWHSLTETVVFGLLASEEQPRRSEGVGPDYTCNCEAELGCDENCMKLYKGRRLRRPG